MTPLYDKIINAWVRNQAHETLKPAIQNWNRNNPTDPWNPTPEWLEPRANEILRDLLQNTSEDLSERLSTDHDGNLWLQLTHLPNPKYDNKITPRDHRLYLAATPEEFLETAARPTVMPVHADSAQAVIDRELQDHNNQILQIPNMPDWETAVKTHTPHGHHDKTNGLYWTLAPIYTDLLPATLYLATPLDTPIIA